MTPHEVKFTLDQKLLELGSPACTASLLRVSVGYDLAPDPTGDGILFFEFELPALVSRNDLRAFGEWLASSGYGGTLH
jgi:hypothetical protein